MFSNLLALLLEKFSILTKQLQIYDSAREVSNFDGKIFYLESFQVRNVIICRLKYIYYRKREKLRAGYYFFFLIRTMLLLTAT